MGDGARLRSFGALREVIDALGAHRSLERGCARAVMDALLSGDVVADDIAAILLAFRDKGVDGEELSGLLDGVRAASLTVTLPDPSTASSGASTTSEPPVALKMPTLR